MARRLTQKQLYEELLNRYGREIADAFMKAVDDLKAGVDLQRVVAALDAGDLNAAIEAMHLDPAAFQRLENAISQAYTAGGQATTESLPYRDGEGARLVVRFSGRNYRAEDWLRTHSSRLVTRIVDDQREAIRTHLQAGMERGDNPRTTALNVIGRVNQQTGKREGGVIGLTSQQEGFVRNARDELASGDPAALRNYLNRARRDKRFDKTVEKAIRDGAPVSKDVIDRATARYSSRLLQLRGEVLSLHESFGAIAAAKHEAYIQAVESGKLAADAVTKTWRHFPSEHPRMQHMALAGKSVRFDRPFVTADGTQLMYPHDPEAPAEHTLNCRCQADYRVDFLAGLE